MAAEMAEREFINALYEENEAFYSDPRGSGALRDVQFAFHPWVYLAELLQNAIDEHATSISFRTDDGRQVLVVEHDGDPFDEKDVRGLCTIGVSRKGAGTVGFMGVGFKSVFKRFERVSISSGGWRFRFDCERVAGQFGERIQRTIGSVLPIWDDAIAPPSTGMTCRFELARPLEALSAVEDDRKRVFGPANELLAILASRGVKRLQWNDTIWDLAASDVFGTTCGVRVYELQAVSTGGHSRWSMFRAFYKPSNEAIRVLLEHRQLEAELGDHAMEHLDCAPAYRAVMTPGCFAATRFRWRRGPDYALISDA